MAIRNWFRNRMLGDEGEGEDVPPSRSLVNTLLGRERERVPSLGEYNAATYPEDLAELVRRREEMASELLRLNLTSREGRIAAVPQLRELLKRYPHPLAYEALIHAYADQGRFDEAKGVAFAAKQRRLECAKSPHPEIRAEIDRLKEWSPEDVDEMRAEREAGGRARG